MTSEFVEQDRDTVDGPAALEMRLDLFGGCAVVDVANKDAARVNVLFALAPSGSGLALAGLLQLAQPGGFGFHLLYALLHRVDLILVGGRLKTVVVVLMLVLRVVRHGAGLEGGLRLVMDGGEVDVGFEGEALSCESMGRGAPYRGSLACAGVKIFRLNVNFGLDVCL